MTDDPFYPSGGTGAPPTGERRKAGDRRHDAVPIVGESDHQETLRSLLDHHGRSVVASLVAEPENPQDPNAVAVVIEEGRVGYLNADIAKRYGTVLNERATPFRCPATLHGGDWDSPTIHVVLDFSLVYVAARKT